MKKTLISTGVAVALGMGAMSAQAELLNIDSWTLGSFGGLDSDFAFAGPPGGPNTNPDLDNTFGADGETGCTNAADGDTCDNIIFGTAVGTGDFSTGFNFGGQGG